GGSGGLGGGGGAGAPGGGFGSDLKPTILWDPSQNGLMVDVPQRHSATVLRPCRSIASPSGVSSAASPRTSRGPFGQATIVVGLVLIAPLPRRGASAAPTPPPPMPPGSGRHPSRRR